MVPECYLVSEIAVGFDATGSQISCDISICGVFTTAKQANDTVLTWHERDYVPVGVGDFEEYKLRKPEGLLHLVASVDGRSWEVSVERIELNTEFSMSLLEPAIPQSPDVMEPPMETVKQETKKRPPGRPRKNKDVVVGQAAAAAAAAAAASERQQVREKRRRSTANRHRIPTTANLLTLPKTTPPRRAPRPRSQEIVSPGAHHHQQQQGEEAENHRAHQESPSLEDRESREREERRRSRVEKELRQLATHV